MKKLINKTVIVTLVLTLVFSISSCEAIKNANNKQKGATIGTAGGAILGAIIGNNVGKGGNGELGAIIGGVVGGGAGVLIGNKMDKQAEKIETEIPGAVVERIDDGIVVTFDENSGVYFDTNKSNINAKSQETLNKLSDVFLEFPDTNILVVGHTDSSGKDEYNMTLSEKRALSVTDYLIAKGLVKNRFQTLWYGETQPKYDNATAEGRAKNRRVNVAIVPNDKMVNDAKIESGGN
ncbi:Outer membrane protein OmpA [Polaribacter sp. KT25b]|uniref:OmpA family protein n=1 Tax=Polaribacter sp. KT25b TaxID=1855336 RepID=UPI00087A8765|nr:OmpA family protein [Polaribacter sp. KT25b]SDS55989.1 Outer membrane protein OmpA [Polaribacter sp. KT25b]